MKKEIITPIMTVGKYKGKQVHQLPNHYLQFILKSDFTEDIKEVARKKLSLNMTSIDNHISVSRHALDTFSIRYIWLWEQYNETLKDNIGLSTFVADFAEEALKYGTTIKTKKHNHHIKYQGITWIFTEDIGLKVLITVI